jgi:ribosomal-protein-alanine N-acetyltransferase
VTQITTTPRFNITKLTHDDNAQLATILSDPQVMRYSTLGEIDEQGIKIHIDKCLASYAKYGWGQWAIVCKESKEVVGLCGLNSLKLDEEDLIHISYRFARAHWRKGFALEAVNAIIEYAFNELSIESVYSIVEPVNQPSVNLAIKAGFTLARTSTFKGLGVNLYRIQPNIERGE